MIPILVIWNLSAIVHSGSDFWVGRFASNRPSPTYPARIDNRILLIYIFNGDEFQYIDNSTNTITSNSASFTDDTFASVTFTPSDNCKAVYLYNFSNITGTEDWYGKKAAISINGVDYSQAEKSPVDNNYPDSIFTCYANALTPIPTTYTGRFAANREGYTVSINTRQLGALLLHNSVTLDIAISDNQVVTTSDVLADDTEALITRDIPIVTELLVIAMGTKRNGTSSNPQGEAYGISVDGIDRQLSRASPYSTNFANSAATCWAETVSAGIHNIQGRFSNNYDARTAKIDSRRVIAVWFLTCPVSPKYSGDTIRLTATPKDGIGPYYVEFLKEGATIIGYTGVPENSNVIYDYVLTDPDIVSATTGIIRFSVFISDSCPSPGPQTCTQYCDVAIGCVAPVCNFTVT